MAFDRNDWNNQYKKEKFDFFGFYTPKGTKEKVTKRAKELGMNTAEYLRHLIEKDIPD